MVSQGFDIVLLGHISKDKNVVDGKEKMFLVVLSIMVLSLLR